MSLKAGCTVVASSSKFLHMEHLLGVQLSYGSSMVFLCPCLEDQQLAVFTPQHLISSLLVSTVLYFLPGIQAEAIDKRSSKHTPVPVG